METEINLWLDQLADDLFCVDDRDSSLMDGRAGRILFLVNYLKHKPTPLRWAYLNESIQALAETAMNASRGDYSNGLSGMNWLFTYLRNQEVLTASDWEILCGDNKRLEDLSLDMLSDGNYDYFYGALGISWYLLYAGNSSGSYYEGIFSLLNRLMLQQGPLAAIPAFDQDTYQPIPDKVDLGLSHGISSVLKYGMQCYAKGICLAEAASLVNGCVQYLMAHARPDGGLSCFPNFIERGGVPSDSRLAWCYGDLGIGYTLFEAGRLFNNKEAIQLGNKVLLHCTYRKTLSQTRVEDPGFCHGSAGVAYMFHKAWLATQSDIFVEARNDWVERTLQMTPFTDNPSLLMGLSGIGLVLTSMLSGDTSWDGCFMLNVY